jgi:GT2 family glycosyltransferase
LLCSLLSVDGQQQMSFFQVIASGDTKSAPASGMWGSAPNRISVCICVATFKRPLGLDRLLRSLSGLKFDKNREVLVRVAVADNDTDGSALAIVQKAASYSKIPIAYEIEPSRGISFARNRTVCMAGQCDYVAFVDDDEVANERWLDELLYAQTLYEADVVVGPVIPAFDYEPPPWIVRGKFFERVRYATGTPIAYGRTGNALISRRALDRVHGPFDQEFALSGAEDTVLFKHLLRHGARIVWCDEAQVTEINPASRNLWWLLKRSFSTANAYVFCERAFGVKMCRLISALKGLILVTSGILAFIPSLIIAAEKTVWACSLIAKGLGQLAGAANIRYEQYS